MCHMLLFVCHLSLLCDIWSCLLGGWTKVLFVPCLDQNGILCICFNIFRFQPNDEKVVSYRGLGIALYL